MCSLTPEPTYIEFGGHPQFRGHTHTQGRDAYERLFEKGVGERPGRYYAQKLVKCSNCKQKGHTPKNCPWPKVWASNTTEHIYNSNILAEDILIRMYLSFTFVSFMSKFAIKILLHVFTQSCIYYVGLLGSLGSG